MSRRDRPRTTLMQAGDLAWAGGVLDAAGHFVVRECGRGDGAFVRARVPAATARRLQAILGGTVVLGNYWRLPADEQYNSLLRVLPYMKTQLIEAERVWKWRLSATKHSGKKVPSAIKVYRAGLKPAVVTEEQA